MSPIFVLVCDTCGFKEEVICHSKEKDAFLCQQPGKDGVSTTCGGSMKPQITVPAGFIVKGYAYRNGYHIPQASDEDKPQRRK